MPSTDISSAIEDWELISEPVRPVPGSVEIEGMDRGYPGLPRRFVWRGTEYEVDQVLRHWKTSSPEGGRGMGDLYVRKHWLEVLTTGGDRMQLYCLRQTPSSGSRWWLARLRRPPRA